MSWRPHLDSGGDPNADPLLYSITMADGPALRVRRGGATLVQFTLHANS
jgi:hypothetical protein